MTRGTTFTKWILHAIAGVAFCIAANPTLAGGGESNWIAGSGGAFSNPSNWDGPVPDSTITAIFDLANTYIVTFDSNAISDRVLIGNGNVTYNLAGFGYSLMNPIATTPSVVVGDLAKGVAQLTITNGSLNAKFTNIGEVAGASGSLFVTNGSDLINDFHLRVGHIGDGVFNLSNSSTASSFVTTIGIQNGVTGSATVAGVGSELSADSALTVALEGIGNLSILDGATATVGNAVIGEQLNSNGSVSVAGTGSTLTVDGPFDVGQTGTGSLEISDGGQVVANSFVTVGTFLEPIMDPILGGVGEIIVDGDGSLLQVQGDLFIGFVAYGRWTLSSGGKVEVVGDIFRGNWLEGDEQPQTIIELASASDYQTPAITSLGMIDSFDVSIELVDGYEPSGGDSFQIASAIMIDAFTFELPSLPFPMFWEVEQDIASIVLRVISPCPWDLDGNGTVGTGDLLELFGQWGTEGLADFDESGVVDTIDLLILFDNWGPCE